MDTNGLPTVTVTSGEFASESAQNQIKQLVGPSQVTVSSLVASFLALATDAVSVIVDSANRVIFGAPASAGADVAAALHETSGFKELVLQPKAGQSGRSLEFEISGTPTTGFPAGLKSAIDNLLAPVTPTYSAQSLVQAILQDMPDNQEAIVHMSQGAGTIVVTTHATHATIAATLNANIDDATPGVCKVVLSEPAAASALVFEGGAV